MLLETLHYQKPKLKEDQLREYDFKNNNKKVKMMTPLHIALEAKNTRIINLLLFYMSKIQYSADQHIKDIFK